MRQDFCKKLSLLMLLLLLMGLAEARSFCEIDSQGKNVQLAGVGFGVGFCLKTHLRAIEIKNQISK